MTPIEAKQLISDAKNICIIPFEHEPESLTAALALFYTLKELGKNVNLITEEFPEKLNFLVPSLDFISSPKNFVISIPRNIADVSQIYYEKNEESLKIHLTVDKGQIKKDNISFYFQEAKPDLVITLGIADMQSQLAGQLNSFGFLLNSPILNIDNSEINKKFGKVNIIENKSLSEIVQNIIMSFGENLIKQNTANCLLAGLVIYYENFKSVKTSPEIFQLSGELIKKGANHHQIIENLYKATEKEINFLGKIFQNMRSADYSTSVAMLDSNEFHNFAETESMAAIEKIKIMGLQNDLLVLWQSHNSDPAIKGFFYSKKSEQVKKISSYQPLDSAWGRQNAKKEDRAFISIPGTDITKAKDAILAKLNVLQHMFN
ncbi:MAG: hypothetical protein A3F47_00540 [Candidatus Staskawiczbacteria bacterium RIFCSPHIGHO2_12_FULL_38_11]|uniref:DDH domain-containing protein n=1 Tax=Candidatus Staskawiczbacteria bacterium RIFCSPHIGHO2_12_FULL_38_11 TaxID=1802209 RepID=A0A1G2I8R3_9BACT|nr:MAG: hypothetical protein A3F47_00540 [Candidatus Staskawiczbacteria bacterium RIFCSPHIGHO2_12_FULL_38_11]